MVDDRGQPVKVLNPAGFQDWPVRGDPRMELLVRRIGLAIQGRQLWKRVGVGVGLTLGYMLVAMALVSVAKRVVPGAPQWLPLVLIVVGASVGGVWLTRAKAAANAAAIAEVTLEEGLCPSCGYNFHGLVEAEDGCVVCPECSGAWRATRIVRTAEFVAGAQPGNVLSTLRTGAQSAGMWSTTDDRGRRVELAHPKLRREIRAAKGSATRTVQLKRVRRKIGRAALGTRLFGLTIVWAVVLLVVGGMGYICWTEGPRAYWFSALAIGAALVGGIATTVGNFCFSPRKTRACLLAEGLCPTCVSDLGDAIPREDGVCVCAWCRSGWRMEEIGEASQECARAG